MVLTLSRLPAAAFLLFLTTSAIDVSSASGQERPSAPNKPIMMTVTVWNKKGHYVKDLRREAFNITDEKTERPIEYFENGDTPASIGILIDTSGSMYLSQIGRAKPVADALAEFLVLGHANNEYFLMSFDKTSRLLADWSTGRTILSKKADIEEKKGSTAMYDACFAAIEKLRTANTSRRVLLLISDGQDNFSKHTFKELRKLLSDSDVTFYAIGVIGPSDLGSSLGIEGHAVLDELTEITGGKAFVVQEKRDMKGAASVIAEELSHQYRIGFLPEQTGVSNKWRRLKIKVTPPPDSPPEFRKLSVRTRPGYYSG